MAAVTSILIRGTGIALTAGITGIGGLSLVGADLPAYMSAIGSIYGVGMMSKFFVSFPLIYHYLGKLLYSLINKSLMAAILIVV